MTRYTYKPPLTLNKFTRIELTHPKFTCLEKLEEERNTSKINMLSKPKRLEIQMNKIKYHVTKKKPNIQKKKYIIFKNILNIKNKCNHMYDLTS